MTWRWSNPRPHGNNIIDMAQADGLTVQIGDRGQIYTSDDWDLWIPRDSHTDTSLRAITFLSGRVVITGENGTVIYADSIEDFKVSNLGTTDWLEGVAAGTDLVVAVGDNGSVYTSINGIFWQRRPQNFFTWLRSVAYAPKFQNDRGVFVTVGEGGFIATSFDGITWQSRKSGTSRDLNKVAWVEDQLWVAGDAGVTLLSTNRGASWQPSPTGATNVLYAFTGRGDSDTGSRSLVAAGVNEVRLQETNVWANELGTNHPSPPPVWTYFCALWDGQDCWLGGRMGMFVDGYKTNTAGPTLWTVSEPAVRNWLFHVTRTPDFYFAAGDHGTVMTSVDGVDWDLELVPDSVTNTVFLGVGGSTNCFIAVGNRGSVVVSTNGTQWTAVEPRPTLNDLQGVGTFGGLLVVTGGGGNILTSSNGMNWIFNPTPTTNFLSSVETFAGGLVVVGYRGTILTSPDANTWTRQTSGTTNWLYRVRYLGGQLIAVGQNGTILTSPDAQTWTKRDSGTSNWLNDITQIEDTYFSVGIQGTVLVSTNTVDWTNLGTITKKSLYGVAAHEGQLVTVGLEGVILRSPVIPCLDPVTLVQLTRNEPYNIFLVAGKTDQRFTLDRCTAFTNWITGPKLEFLDSSGTLLLYEKVDIEPLQFYRGTVVP